MHSSASAICATPFNTWQTCYVPWMRNGFNAFPATWSPLSHCWECSLWVIGAKRWNDLVKTLLVLLTMIFIYELSVGSPCLASCSHPSPFTLKSKKRMPASVLAYHFYSFLLFAKANQRNAKGCKTIHSITAPLTPNKSIQLATSLMKVE